MKAKSAGQRASSRKPAPSAKTTVRKSARVAKSGAPKKKVVLLSGGNPQIAKADGDAPVQAYIAALSGWQREAATRLDTIIARAVPNVQKAVKWNSPFYGVEGRGYFLSLHTFTRYLKIAFFRGASLRPMPPGESRNADTRYLDIHEDSEIDAAQLAKWVKQAAKLPGYLNPRN
jgi:hypothetical protein